MQLLKFETTEHGYIDMVHKWVHWRDNNLIKITKFAICGLCFFVHVIEYTITIEKPFSYSYKNNYIIIHRWMKSKLDDIVHFSFTFSMKIILVVNCSHIYN
jgi:hypothetical protein